MLTVRLSRFFDLSEKALDLFSAVMKKPSLIPKVVAGAFKGAHPNELIRIDVPWLRQRRIRTVIDVGAHTGQFSAAAQFIIPDAQIYAFEPLPDCFAVLRRRFAGKLRFKAFNVAIGDLAGEESIWRSSFAKSSSMLRMGDLHKRNFPWTAELTQQNVTVARLDDFLEEMEIVRPLLLKIDVQGYEDKVLKGASRVLESTDIIVIEVSFAPLYESQATFSQIYRFLSAASFEFGGVLGQRASPIDGSILQADALFQRSR